MNALLKYAGGKWRIAPWIISHFPPHKVYCEPFFGSGAVFFTKSPCHIETINDIDGNIVNLFRVCRDFPEELARALDLTPWSRDEFMNCLEKADDPIEQARRTVVRFHQSYATCNHSKKSWRNVQKHNGPRCADVWNRLPEIVLNVCERLKQAQIENIDAIELIKRYNSTDTLLYLDPPYPLKLRDKNMYKYEMADEQHEELLRVVLKSKAKIVLSSYDNELYNETLKDWYTSEKQTIAQSGARRTEKIYMNFQPPLLSIMGGGWLIAESLIIVQRNRRIGSGRRVGRVQNGRPM